MKRILGTLVVICLCLLAQISQALQTEAQPQQSSVSASISTAQSGPSKSTCKNNGTYLNREGQVIPRPESCSAAPAGASERLHNAAMERTISAGIAALRAHTTAVLQSGCEKSAEPANHSFRSPHEEGLLHSDQNRHASIQKSLSKGKSVGLSCLRFSTASC